MTDLSDFVGRKNNPKTRAELVSVLARELDGYIDRLNKQHGPVFGPAAVSEASQVAKGYLTIHVPINLANPLGVAMARQLGLIPDANPQNPHAPLLPGGPAEPPAPEADR